MLRWRGWLPPPTSTQGDPQLRQRRRLDLTDPRWGHAERIANLATSHRCVFTETEPRLNDARLTFGKSLELALEPRLQHREVGCVGRVYRLAIFDGVAERNIFETMENLNPSV